MDWIEVNGTSLRYDLTGSGDRTLVLVHEIGRHAGKLGPRAAGARARPPHPAL